MPYPQLGGMTFALLGEYVCAYDWIKEQRIIKPLERIFRAMDQST